MDDIRIDHIIQQLEHFKLIRTSIKTRSSDGNKERDDENPQEILTISPTGDQIHKPPILRLPSDVVVKIFTFTVRFWPKLPLRSKEKPDIGTAPSGCWYPIVGSNQLEPFNLLSVCADWHRIVMSRPDLWSRFRLNLDPRYSVPWMDPPESFLQRQQGACGPPLKVWLERSQDKPLSIFFNGFVEDNSALPWNLLQTSPRWKSVEFSLKVWSKELFQKLLAPIGFASQLECLTLEILLMSSESLDPEYLMLPLGLLPHLRTLNINHIQFPRLLDLTHPNALTHLKVEDTYVDSTDPPSVLRLLNASPYLAYLSVTVHAISDYCFGGFPSSNIIMHSKLRSLELHSDCKYMAYFLSHLELPSLTNLLLEDIEMSYYQRPENIERLQTSSGAFLRSFGTDIQNLSLLLEHFSDNQIITLLRYIPQIKKLTVQTGTLSNIGLRALVLPSNPASVHTDDATLICRQLIYLSWTYRKAEFEIQQLVKTVHSRWIHDRHVRLDFKVNYQRGDDPARYFDLKDEAKRIFRTKLVKKMMEHTEGLFLRINGFKVRPVSERSGYDNDFIWDSDSPDDMN